MEILTATDTEDASPLEHTFSAVAASNCRCRALFTVEDAIYAMDFDDALAAALLYPAIYGQSRR